MAFSADDIRWMHSALALSRRGLGQVWPNPSVGCIIVKDGVVLGRGVTAPTGRPHAEAAALAQAGDAARGATAYVTLEPCGRPGRDESCTDKLIRAGVARVVFAATDPNPMVNGHGCDRLQAAGIDVDRGVLEAAATRSHAGFFSRIVKGRPLATLKLATSLDGRIATASGESRWITGPDARRLVHLMRASHDAVMIGIGTALADDPMLDVRELGIGHNPVRVVLDSRLQLPLGSKLVQSAQKQPLWIIHGPDISPDAAQFLRAAGAKLFEAQTDSSGRVDLALAMTILGSQGLTRLFVEGGARLSAALIAGSLVDELVIFAAGKVIGAEGLAAIGPLGLSELSDAAAFKLVETAAIVNDTVTHWRRV